MLWRIERKKVIKLERQLEEWQNRLLEKANVRPLYKPPPQPVKPVERPPIGITEKRAWAKRQQTDNIPTAEEILGAAERATKAS